MEKTKKDLKEFESEMNVNSEFFGLFREELLNIAEKTTTKNKKSNKNKDKSSTQYTKKSKIETTTLLPNLTSDSDSSSLTESSNKSNSSNSSNPTNSTDSSDIPVNKKTGSEKELSKKSKTIINEDTEDLNMDLIEMSEYEEEKFKQILKYFVDINK